MRNLCFCKSIVVLFLIIAVLTSSPAYANYETTNFIVSPSQETFEKLNEDFGFESKSAILVESKSGAILFEKNSHEHLAPASITKIMSMLLFMEAIDSNRISYDDLVSVSEHAQSMGGSQIWLETGEQMSVRDLMKTIVVNSANDATVALAEHIAGSEEVFVRMMNEKAELLGMKDTNFINCSGLDADDHYTSAYDVALVSRELMNKHPEIVQFTTIWMDSVRDGEFGLANTNKLVRHYKGTTGIKTGSTSKAGFCLSASAKRDNLELISVVMSAPNSKTRFLEASKLLNYGFANFQSVVVKSKGETAASVQIKKGEKSTVEAIYPENISMLLKKGEKREITSEIFLDENITAPISKGQNIGSVIFKIEGTEIGRASVVAAETIEKVNPLKLMRNMLMKWINANRT